MKTRILPIGVVSLLLGAMFVGMFGFVGEVEASSNDWIENFITDTPMIVMSVAIGDADNDGNNEVVIGMGQSTNELKVYKKMAGVWVEEIIANLNIDIQSIAIGDADNDGYNEVVVGTRDPSWELKLYEKDGGVWKGGNIVNTANTIQSVAIGDADNDGKNEIVIGQLMTTDEVRAYEWDTGSGIWVEDIIYDVGDNHVYSVAIGDANNDGNMEVVIGLSSTQNEVRAYENVSGIWVEQNITNAANDVWSVAIGDATNDGLNEVVFGQASTTMELRWSWWNVSTGWDWDLIADVDADVRSLAIGDADNDGINEIVIGTESAANEVRAYEYQEVSETWIEDIIADLPDDVLSVAIGDADNEGNNEVVISSKNPTYEVRVYALDRGEITFTSHENGDYVSGTATFEVLVTSSHVNSVKFYVDDEPKFTDSSYPYQFINDTTKLTEDVTYTIKAEGLRDNAPPLIATVDVIVNNAVQTGDYITVSTLETEYVPDQDVSVVVVTNSPPSFNSLNLVVSYVDPSGNTKHSINELLPYATQYIVTLPLSSDAALGTYTVTAHAYGFDDDVMIWEAANGTTFDVSGKNLQEQLADLSAQHEVLNNTIKSLSNIIENEHEFTRSEILDRINASIAEIQSLEDTTTAHDSEIKATLDSLNDLVENEHNLTKTELLDELAEVLSQLQDVDAEITSHALDVTAELLKLDDILDRLDAHDQALESTQKDVEDVSSAQNTYSMIAIVLIIIAIIMLLVGIFLILKGNKMLSQGMGGTSKGGAYPEEGMEPEGEVEPEVEEAYETVEEEPMEEIEEEAPEEPEEGIDEVLEELEEKPKKSKKKKK